MVFIQPSQHAEAIVLAAKNSDTFKYLPDGPWASGTELIQEFWEGRVFPSKDMTLFAIYDKTRESESGEGPALAGMIAYLNSSATDLFIEIGWITILPAFRRSHVTSNAVGILMHYALDLPSSESDEGTSGGLGLRRCVWIANVLNTPSVNAGERMGFIKEGIMRWHRVLPESKKVGWNGREERKGDPREGCGGRDSIILSHCFDDWENGGRQKVGTIMDRRV